MESALQFPESNAKDRVRMRNILLSEIRDVALQSCGFTASLEGMLVMMKKWNMLKHGRVQMDDEYKLILLIYLSRTVESETIRSNKRLILV